MSSPAGEKLVSPSAVLKQVAAAVPEDFRKNIIIVGSLAAGYYFFRDNSRLQVRTKDVDCLLSPRIQAIPAGKAVADRLFADQWQLRSEGEWGQPGDASTPLDKLPLVRLYPPGSTEWFIELITVSESELDLDRKDIRLVTSKGHFSSPQNRPDLEEAHHSCINGLLASHSSTLALLEVTGQRLLQDAVEPLERMASQS